MTGDEERYAQLEHEADQESRRLAKSIHENDALKARITELEAENDRLKRELHDINMLVWRDRKDKGDRNEPTRPRS